MVVLRHLHHALFLLIVLLTACSGEQEGDDVIDIVYDPCVPTVVVPASDSTTAEIASIDEALRLWQVVTNVHFAREVVEGAPVLPIRFEEASPVFRGIYLDEVGDIVVNRLLHDPKDRDITLAHELGHALGLPHIDDRDSVMNRGNLELEPLITDAEGVEALWGPCAETSAPTPPHRATSR